MRPALLLPALLVAALPAPALAGGLFGGNAAEYDWTGFYVGLTGGASRADLSTTDVEMRTTGALIGIAPGPELVFGGPDTSETIDAQFAGVRAGAAWQAGVFVLGVEAGINASNQSSSSSFLGSAQGPLHESTSRLDYFGTATLRAGLAFDAVQVYGKAGLAIGQGSADLAVTPGIPPSAATPFEDSQQRLHYGYALGGGLEIAVTENISLTAEYQYLDLGAQEYVFAFPDSDGSTVSATSRLGVQTVSGGVNFRF